MLAETNYVYMDFHGSRNIDPPLPGNSSLLFRCNERKTMTKTFVLKFKAKEIIKSVNFKKKKKRSLRTNPKICLTTPPPPPYDTVK